MQKIKVAILFGGRSTEHQISLLSAQNVFNALDKEKFTPVLIAIDKKGQWHLSPENLLLENKQDANQIALSSEFENPVLISQNTNQHQVISLDSQNPLSTIDVLFPVLHGNYGEDGSVQGLAKLANLPCVGCGIIGSAVGMDKEIMKHVLRSNDVEVAKWVTVRASNPIQYSYEELIPILGKEMFIKPANQGSSVGVYSIKTKEEFDVALPKSLSYDPKVIIEEKIVGRELECAILGNLIPKASAIGEVVTKDGFYSYENKYLDEKGAELHIPAQLSENQVEAIQQLAIQTYKALECRGMSRVDLFMTAEEKLIINEINTIPGFTNISMYPKLWEASGLNQKDLITELIMLAIEEQKAQNTLLLG